MIRKCRLRSCRSPLPPKKDCAPGSPEAAGFCAWDHHREHEQGKRADAKPIARRPAKPRRRRKPRAGDSRSYLDWVKTQPCVLCGQPADDPHHIIGMGFGGMGMQAPDLLSMPCCRHCHNRIHADPELWARQPLWVLRTQAKAIQEGVLE